MIIKGHFHLLLSHTYTPFKPDEFQRVHPLKFFGLKGICRWTPGEHRWNTNELLSKSYPPRPLLVNREFIGVQRWFAGKKSGLKGFPVNTDENADEVLGTARCRNVHFLLSCWLADDVIRGWMIFIGVHRRLVWKGGGKIHRCFTSGILPVDSSGVQRVPTGKVGLKGVLVLTCG